MKFWFRENTLKPLKMNTFWGMQNWLSYRGANLMELLHLSTIDEFEHI